MQAYLFVNIILVIMGCFLPWIHAAIFVVRLRGIDIYEGKIVLAMAMVALGFLFYQTIFKKRLIPMLYGAIGLTILALTGLDLYTFYINNYPTGPGVYLSLVGGAQMLGCALFCKIKRLS